MDIILNKKLNREDIENMASNKSNDELSDYYVVSKKDGTYTIFDDEATAYKNSIYSTNFEGLEEYKIEGMYEICVRECGVRDVLPLWSYKKIA